MKFILSMTCVTLSLLAFAEPAKATSPDAPKLQRFEFSGLEARVFYNAESPLEKGSPATLAVVHVHGWGGGADVAREELPLIQALRAAMKPGDVPPYVISPLFPRRAILKRKKEPVDGRAIWNDSWRGSLADAVAPNDDWRGGGDAVGTHLSSYDVIDRLFATLSDKSRFPNLKRVVMTGYSAGGQFVGRYAAVGKGSYKRYGKYGGKYGYDYGYGYENAGGKSRKKIDEAFIEATLENKDEAAGRAEDHD